MLSAAPTRDEEDSAQLCRLILKSFGADQGNEVRRLVSANPRCVNAPGRTGETPLFLAVGQRNADLVKFLLASAADPNGAAAANGRTALHELASTSSHATAKKDCELVEALVMYNASVARYDANHSQAIDIARMYNAPDSVQRLLAPGGRSGGGGGSAQAVAAAAGFASRGALDGLSYASSPRMAAGAEAGAVAAGAVGAAAATPERSRVPATGELLSLYSQSAQSRRQLAESQRMVEDAVAQQRVDELLAAATQRQQHEALLLQHPHLQPPSASASASPAGGGPVVASGAGSRLGAAAVADLGPYRLLHDKAVAELRAVKRELRVRTEEAAAARARAAELEAANRELAKAADLRNLERANAAGAGAASPLAAEAALTEYKRQNHRRLGALQQALSRLKGDIKDSDEEIARLTEENSRLRAGSAADRRLIAALKREVDELARGGPHGGSGSSSSSSHCARPLSPGQAQRLLALSAAVHSSLAGGRDGRGRDDHEDSSDLSSRRHTPHGSPESLGTARSEDTAGSGSDWRDRRGRGPSRDGRRRSGGRGGGSDDDVNSRSRSDADDDDDDEVDDEVDDDDLSADSCDSRNRRRRRGRRRPLDHDDRERRRTRGEGRGYAGRGRSSSRSRRNRDGASAARARGVEELDDRDYPALQPRSRSRPVLPAPTSSSSSSSSSAPAVVGGTGARPSFRSSSSGSGDDDDDDRRGARGGGRRGAQLRHPEPLRGEDHRLPEQHPVYAQHGHNHHHHHRQQQEQQQQQQHYPHHHHRHHHGQQLQGQRKHAAAADRDPARCDFRDYRPPERVEARRGGPVRIGEDARARRRHGQQQQQQQQHPLPRPPGRGPVRATQTYHKFYPDV